MNKSGLIFCFLFVISYIQAQETNETIIFDMIVNITKGLTDNNEYKCTNILKNNREKLLNVTMAFVNNSSDLSSALFTGAAQLLFVRGFATDCNVGKNLLNVKKLSKDSTLIFQIFWEFLGLLSKIKEISEEKLIKFGESIRNRTGITLH